MACARQSAGHCMSLLMDCVNGTCCNPFVRLRMKVPIHERVTGDGLFRACPIELFLSFIHAKAIQIQYISSHLI